MEIEDVQATSPAPKKRAKSTGPIKKMGERSVNKIDDGVYVVTHVGPRREPLAPKMARAKFSSQCGAIVRDNIPITLKEWDKVTDGQKKHLWEELNKRIKFPKGTEEAAKNCALQRMDKSWHGWKNTLNTKFVQTGKTLFAKYGKLSSAQWDEFVKFKTSLEEMAKSKKMSELAKKNKFPHCLGSSGYAPKIEEWNKQDEELRKTGAAVPMEEWNAWTKHWVKARSPKITQEGKIQFEDPGFQQVAEKIELLTGAERKGHFTPIREKDALSQVLGNKEHGGRVQGVSSKLSWKEGFKQEALSYKKR